MTQEATSDPGASPTRRGRGPSKPYPVVPFRDAVKLAQGILTYGIDGDMQRLTLLDKLDMSPTSSRTRDLITGSTRYGLTAGSYSATSLRVTEDGRVALDPSVPPRTTLEKQLFLSIMKFDPFKDLYDRLRGNRLPDAEVMGDQLAQNGVSAADAKKAASIFTANLRHLGLIKDIKGNDYVTSLDEVSDSELKNVPEPNPHQQPVEPVQPHQGATSPVAGPPPSLPGPSLHLDVQVHIDSSATPEQIETIFASMAKHLYGREF